MSCHFSPERERVTLQTSCGAERVKATFHRDCSLEKCLMILSSAPVEAKPLLILLDLSAIVDHGILIEKLFYCGIVSVLAFHKS